MTDKERIEKTYKKIQSKYPQVTDKDEIDNLAIKYDKRNTVLLCLGCLVGAIACAVVFFLLIGNETFETTRYLFLVMVGTGIFECFRTLGKYSKIEQRYRPVVKVKHEGTLTKEKILQDGGKLLKKTDNAFKIAKLALSDKEDETEVGYNNFTYHTYRLHFKHPENGLKLTYKVSRDRYMEAVIGAEYYVILTPSEIASVYRATNWSISSELCDLFVGEQPEIIEGQVCFTAKNEPENENPASVAYQPSAIKTKTEPEKTKKLLPILSIVLAVIGGFTPIIVAVPFLIAAFVLSVIGLARQRTKLSIVALIVNVVMFLLAILSGVAILMGIV